MMKYYWHIHHDVLLESSEKIKERIRYIIKMKPKKEIPLRLKLIKPIIGQLPVAMMDADRDLRKAEKKFNRMYKVRFGKNVKWTWKHNTDFREASWTLSEAFKKRHHAYIASMPEIELLHKSECPNCPWDGKTIFPRK